MDAELPGYLGPLVARVASAREQEDAARQRLAQAKRARAYWEALISAITDDRPAGALLLLRRGERELQPLCEADSAISSSLAALRADAERRAASRAADFDREFPEALLAAGMPVDPSSRHPYYTVKDGFIHIEVDAKELIAKVTPRDGDTLLVALDVASLTNTVRSAVERLFGRAFDAGGFLQRLYVTYRDLLQAEGRPDGDAVPIRRVAGGLTRGAGRRSVDQFNVDLAALLQSRCTSVDGVCLQVQHTRDSKQGMLLYGLEQGGYAGLLSFRREDGP